MEDNLTVIMFCQVLQTIIMLFFYLVWIYGINAKKDCVQINAIKDRNADKQEVIHCGGTPASGWCDECKYGFRNEKGYRQCFAPDIDGMEKVGRIKPKEKNDACD